jgi:hypothetical protein
MMGLILSVLLIANLIAVLVLLYRADDIFGYAVKTDGIKIKHVAFVIIFLPAVLVFGLATLVTYVAIFIVSTRWYEKMISILNKRIN